MYRGDILLNKNRKTLCKWRLTCLCMKPLPETIMFQYSALWQLLWEWVESDDGNPGNIMVLLKEKCLAYRHIYKKRIDQTASLNTTKHTTGKIDHLIVHNQSQYKKEFLFKQKTMW